MISFLDEIRNIASGRDFKQKFLCILAAVVLWAYVGNTRTSEIKLRVPIEFRNLPAAMMVENSRDQFITVRLSGRQEDIKIINAKNIRTYVDLENAVVSDQIRYPVELLRTEIPEGVRVDLSRDKVLLSIQRKLTKRVPIIVRTAGEIKEGFLLGAHRTVPAYVNISGAESGVREVESVFTREVRVDGQSKSVTREVELDLDEHRDLSADIQKLAVFIQIIDVRGLVRMEAKARIRNPDEQYEYRPAIDTVAVYLKPLHDGEPADGLLFDVTIDPGLVSAMDFPGDAADSVVERQCMVTAVLRNRQDDFRIMHVLPDAISVKIRKKAVGPEPQ
ncbi:MAG TPA: hypothetical protein VLM75_14915 [Spirochaetota bacterium]|nr:hypothetical protein [Spirochaetota bacterium]